MRKAKKTAVCGMLTAVSVVLMALTTLLPVMMYVLPILTGLIVMFVYKAMDIKYGLAVYLATSVLCLVLITDKEAALTYALIFGYYPLVKDKAERLPKVISWLIKLLLFNCAAVLIGVLGIYLVGVSGDEYTEFGRFTIPILLVLANLVFLLYDFSLTKNKFLINIISEKFRKKLK